MSSLYLLGNCLEVMKSLPDSSVDCFICDLPYGQLATIGCGWDVKIDLVQFWVHVKRLARNDNTPVLMFCNTRFGIDLINSNPTWFRYDVVWSKGRGINFLLANQQPMKSHEMIYVFSKKGSYYKRIDVMTDRGPYVRHNKDDSHRAKQYGLTRAVDYVQHCVDGTRCVVSVVESPTSSRRGGHPTEKPAALLKWLLERYCPDGGTVLDPTAGSFSAVRVAEALGLDGIGIEMDEGFFTAAVERLAAEHPELLSEPPVENNEC